MTNDSGLGQIDEIMDVLSRVEAMVKLAGLSMPGAVWAMRVVYWIPVPDCWHEFGCLPPEGAHCHVYLTIGDSRFHAPIGVKVTEKIKENPNKKGNVATEFIQDASERTYSMEELGIATLSPLLEIVLDLPLPTTPYVFLTITNRAGDLYPSAPCYEGLPIRIFGIRRK